MRKITTSAHMPTEIKVENVSENVAKVLRRLRLKSKA